MAVLEVVINAKVYQIGCDDKEKDYIKAMISELNEKLEKLKKQNASFFEGVDDEKLFLYQLLLIYSEFKELKKKKNVQKVANSHKEDAFADKEEQNLNQVVNKIQGSVDKLNKLLNYK